MKRIIINFALIVATIVSGVMLLEYKSLLGAVEAEEILNLPVIYNNVFIDSMAVGGLTKEQALEKLNREKQETLNAKKAITIRTADNSFSRDVTSVELGFTYNYELAVEQAYNYGREGSVMARKAIVDELENKGHFITTEYNFDENVVKQVLQDLEGEINDNLASSNEKVDIDRLTDMVVDTIEIEQFDVAIVVPVQ